MPVSGYFTLFIIMKNLFENNGIISDNILHLSPKEVFELCQKGAVLVDVREEFMIGYKKFEVPIVIYLPLTELKTNFDKLPINKYIIFADAAGLRSKEAATFLVNKEFKNIANMAGGLVEWERDKLPLKTNNKEKLTGSCVCQLKPRNKKQSNL